MGSYPKDVCTICTKLDPRDVWVRVQSPAHNSHRATHWPCSIMLVWRLLCCRLCSTDGCCAAGCVQLTAVVLQAVFNWRLLCCRLCSTDGCCAAGRVQLTAVVLQAVFNWQLLCCTICYLDDSLPWQLIVIIHYLADSLLQWFVILMIRYLDSLPWCQWEVPPEPWKGCAQWGDSEAWTSAEVQMSGWCRQTSHGCPSGCWQTDQWERRTLPPCTPGTQPSAWGERAQVNCHVKHRQQHHESSHK